MVIGAGLDVVLLVDLGVDHARSLPEVEPARGVGGCDGASHYGGPGDNYSPCWSLPNSVWEHFFLF